MKKYQSQGIFFALIKTIAFLLLFSLLICSCKTIRYVERVKVETDSLAVHQRDSLIQVKRSDSLTFSKQIESLSENFIIFSDTGTTRIIYRPDGSIESIEGKLKSANNSLSKKDWELLQLKSAYDSLARVKNKTITEVKTIVQERIVEKKTSLFNNFLFWLIVAVALVVGYWIKKKVP